MALVKTIADIQTVLPVLDSVNVAAFLPVITRTERKYLRDGVLGKTLYDALHTAYQADVTLASNTAWRPLLLHCQEAMVLLGCYKALPLNNVLWTSGGLQVNSSPASGQVVASEYRSRAAQQALLNQGFDALDQVIGWMWEHKSDVSTWTQSEFYRQHGLGIVRQVKDFEQGGIRINGSGWLLWMILPALRRAEGRVRDLLCQTAYDEITALLAAGTSLSAAQQSVVDIARQAVAHIAMAESVVPLHLKTDDDGVCVFEASNSAGAGAGGSKPAPDRSKDALIESYKTIGETMFTNVEKEARRLAALGQFATYAASSCYTSGQSQPHQGNPDSSVFAML